MTQRPSGRVHLGVVHLFELEQPDVVPREEGLGRSRVPATIERCGRIRHEFETWSQICIDSFLRTG